MRSLWVFLLVAQIYRRLVNARRDLLKTPMYGGLCFPIRCKWFAGISSRGERLTSRFPGTSYSPGIARMREKAPRPLGTDYRADSNKRSVRRPLRCS
ncbi:protein of unknown function [Cupriavidus taiwanensis]|uniref:Uncharacterized protein n=1 Tax=Cupriavidus taiwanensis TaxID=164546 RepID=A0A7Z7NJB5_9BURK|nr:protein of unknown function [Cupriavidus taiwanensis]SOZ02775.1 hypothetical protein CBM2597_A10104 [Cupriavidus taiwanensis]SPC06142.1 hypothetical protein CBM2594_A10104 [Cupriavidus taiwanensis]SPD38173.1 protein of unknown function [Cupriavidus taiwanensis]